jgi:hypothetical protein
MILETGCSIAFAHTSFKWSNLARNEAGVTVVVVGISRQNAVNKRLYAESEPGNVICRIGESISPYLTIWQNIIVKKQEEPISILSIMEFGNKPSDGGHLLLRYDELSNLKLTEEQRQRRDH